MQPEARKYLHDMETACERLTEFTRGKDLTAYLTDAMLRSAVERQFEILGEALNGLFKADPTTADMFPDRRRIVGFRNILIHGYATIDDRIVWDVVQEYGPGLKLTVRRLLEPPNADT